MFLLILMVSIVLILIFYIIAVKVFKAVRPLRSALVALTLYWTVALLNNLTRTDDSTNQEWSNLDISLNERVKLLAQNWLQIEIEEKWSNIRIISSNIAYNDSTFVLKYTAISSDYLKPHSQNLSFEGEVIIDVRKDGIPYVSGDQILEPGPAGFVTWRESLYLRVTGGPHKTIILTKN